MTNVQKMVNKVQKEEYLDENLIIQLSFKLTSRIYPSFTRHYGRTAELVVIIV